jgi:7,8-dihydropterin-6-yl-methyl-4-(beta-D-ribofuranosyl)aminobenzene 5'-phosphate synthase
MKTKKWWMIFSLLVAIHFLGGSMQLGNITAQPSGKEAHTITITILYDNYQFDDRLKTDWGFSCLIEGLEKTILFDTGGNGAILMDNMNKLMVDPHEIDAVFLSHEHWDHTGGLQDFLKHNHKAVVYLLASFPENIKSSITRAGAKFVEITSSTYIGERIATTGELGANPKEQSLIIETSKGLVIITGCAHPGVVNIVEMAKNYLSSSLTGEAKGEGERDIYMVFGGFHLGGYSDSELMKMIQDFRKLGVVKVGPCHCSGDRCRVLFKEEYKDDFVEIGVGKTILINGDE